jgi:hypothetical protein
MLVNHGSTCSGSKQDARGTTSLKQPARFNTPGFTSFVTNVFAGYTRYKPFYAGIKILMNQKLPMEELD